VTGTSGHRVEVLGADHRAEVTALWEQAGLTRPWNDPDGDFARAVSGPTSAVLGIVGDDGLLATAMVGHDGHRGWIYYVAVRDSLHGQGLGRSVMAAAEGWLHRAGAPKVQLMVRADNTAVADFYRRLGYDAAGVTVFARWLDG